MKKRICNFFLMFLMVFAIFSCKDTPTDVVYTITLDSQDSTSKGDEKLYYNATTGLYYSSSQMTTPITRITPPEKVWKIKLLGNTNTESIEESFTFNGYRDPSLTSKDTKGDMLIGGDGQIDKSKQIKKDALLVADWGEQNSVNVSIQKLRETVSTNQDKLLPEGYEFRGFLYNKKEYSLFGINDTSSDSGVIRVTENEAEIRLITELEGGKKLILDSGDANSEGSVKALYYKFESTQDGNNWFSSPKFTGPKTKLTGAELPKKEYSIILHSNDGQKDPDPKTTKFPFNGYVYSTPTQSYRYVGQDGIINTNLLDSDPIKNVESREDITALAVFGSQTTVRLPSLSRDGYVFNGWSREENKEGEGEFLADRDRVIQYSPEKGDENNTIVLYAQWLRVTPRSLILKDNSNPDYSVTIYYQAGRGWFEDENCEKALTTLSTLPRRTSTIQYVSSRSDKKNPESVTYEWTFEGFKNSDESIMYVSSKGNIQNISISSDSIAYAFWTTKNNSIELPMSQESGFVSDENYKFWGWSDDGGKTILTNPTYRPKENSSSTIVLSAVWEDLRVYELTLNSLYMEGDVKTNISKLYFKPVTTYKYQYDEEEKVNKRVIAVTEGWYRDGDCETQFSGFSQDELPGRVYHVYYNINKQLENLPNVKKDEDYVWKFGGYGSYIGSDGNLLKDNEGKTVRLSSEKDTAIIKWEAPSEGIILQSLGEVSIDGKTEKHVGWIYKGENDAKISIGAEFIPKNYIVNLEPVWESSSFWSLTLNVEGASDEGTREIVYWEKDQKWHSNYVDENEIKQIDIPTKEYVVSFDPVESGTDPSSFENQKSISLFDGYEGYIDKNGNIVARSISKDVIVKARWESASEISTSPGEPKKENLRFVQWCERDENGNLNPISFPYTPRGDTTLYAKYENLNKYQFELKSNGATNSNTTKYIYYWMQDNAWHITPTSGAKLTKINVPEKIYTVSFDVNNSLISPIQALTSASSFGGYRSDDGTYYIDQRGNIIDGRTISNNAGSATAVWGDQEGITLPSLTSPGYKFKGWTKPNVAGKGYGVGEEVPDEAFVKRVEEIGSPYQPEKNETLYAYWERDEHYKLTLDRENKVNPDDDLGVEYKTDAIYYFKGDGWYLDENGTIKANEIVIPIRKYKVEFEPNLEGVEKPERCEANFEFLGYGDIISSSGKVNPESSITSSNAIVAYWKDTEGVDLPTPKDYQGHKFVRWTLKDGTQVELNNDGKYVPVSANTILYGEWVDTTPYTLTFDTAGATTQGTSSITYKPYVLNGEAGWYENSESTESSPLPMITPPKKEWAVVFDTRGPDGKKYGDISSKTSKWDFLGYNDGNQQYVYADGSINQDTSISVPKTVKAAWGNQTSVNLSSIIPEGFNTENKKNGDLYFNGWALLKDDKQFALPVNYYPSAEDVESNEVQLKAIYTEEQVYTITLNDNGATEKGTNVVYYAPSDKKWHPERETQTEITSINAPKKQWRIIFNSNEDGVENPSTQNYTFIFDGYYLGDVKYIDENGKFTSEYPIENIELKAMWSRPNVERVGLETLNKSGGYTFKGWTAKLRGDVTSVNNTGVYDPSEEHLESDNETINLYGFWQKNNVYKLTLDGQGESEQINKEIYYRVDGGWYSDSECTVPITRIETPQKEYYISFEIMTSDVNVSQPKPLKSGFVFNGYGTRDDDGGNTYVNYAGNILQGSSLQRDTTVYAQWVNRTPITLPSLVQDGYTFIGWSRKKSSDIDFDPNNDQIYAGGSSFTPGDDEEDVVLYAYWESNKIWELKLYYNNGNNKTNNPDETLYYSVMRKEWYKDQYLTGQPITSVTKPQRRAQIVFDSGFTSLTVPNTIVKMWTFKGYEDFINDNGEIDTRAALNSSRSVKAVWEIQESEPLPELTLEGYVFEGWTEANTRDIVVAEPYNPIDDNFNASYNNGIITLYAKWRDDSVKVLELDSNGATTSTTSQIYFKKDNEGNNRWYSTGVDPQDKNIITGIEIPKRVVNVNFNVSSQSPRKIEKTPSSYTMRYTFDGFYRVGSDGNIISSKQDIDSKGIINANLSDVERAMARAKWTDPSEVRAPSGYTYSGYTFKGWSSTSPEGPVSIPSGGSIVVDTTGATPGSINGNTTLFDVWDLNHVYTATLDNNGADSLTQGTSKVYYLTDDTWYSNWSGNQGDAPTSKATTITIPKKNYTITYDYDGGQGPSAKTTTTPLTFLGYADEDTGSTHITANGVIVSGYTISEDTTLVATWAKAKSITLPSVTDITKEGFQCVGWALKQGETDDSKIYTGEYVPEKDNLTLYAQWVSTKVYRVTLVNNGATSSEVNRIYLRDSNKLWYKNTTDKTPISVIKSPQKIFTVTFSHGLQVDTPQESYTYTFDGYWTTPDGDNSGTKVISPDASSGNSIISSSLDWLPRDAQGNIEDNTLLYAHWKADVPIDLRNINASMTEASINVEKYFVGWSRYSSGTSETIIQAPDGTAREDDDPLGLLIKAREFTPTSASTTLYAIFVDTTTYIVKLYPNTSWSSGLSGDVKTLYYRPNVAYNSPWFEGTGNGDLTTALRSATETIIENITVGTSNYPLKRWDGGITKSEKTAQATLRQSWPSSSLASLPSFSSDPSSASATTGGFAVGYMEYVYDETDGKNVGVFHLAPGSTLQTTTTTFNIAWKVESSGYYYYNESATSEDERYGAKWVNSSGVMDEDNTLIPNIQSYAKNGTDSSGRVTHTITLGAKFTTISDTWDLFNKHNLYFSDDFDSTPKTGYPYRHSGWATTAHSDDDPSDNRDNIVLGNSDWAPSSSSFSLYGSWYKQIAEELTLVSEVGEGESGGTTAIYYEVSSVGGRWYYVSGEDNIQYDISTPPGTGELVDDTAHIVIPEHKFTVTFDSPQLVGETTGTGGQAPVNPNPKTSSAKFNGYLNPDYTTNAEITREDWQTEKYIINEEGYLTLNKFRKDSTMVGKADGRKLDGATELLAEWEGGTTIDKLDQPTDTGSAMANAGYTFTGWSEIYGWDENGAMYLSEDLLEDVSIANMVEYPFDPSGSESFPLTFKGGTIDTLAKAKSQIEALAEKQDGASVSDPLYKVVKDYLNNASNFADTSEQKRIANLYYWAGSGAAEGQTGQLPFTPMRSTKLYSVWAEKCFFAVLMPEDIQDTTWSAPQKSSDGASLSVSNTSYASKSYTLTYPLGSQNWVKTTTGSEADGVIFYLVLLHANDGVRFAKNAHFNEGVTISDLYTALQISKTNNLDANIGTPTAFTIGTTTSNGPVVEVAGSNHIRGNDGTIKALALRLRGYIEQESIVNLGSDYKKLIIGGTSSSDDNAKMEFKEAKIYVNTTQNTEELESYSMNDINASLYSGDILRVPVYANNEAVFTSGTTIAITDNGGVSDANLLLTQAISSDTSSLNLILRGNFSSIKNYTIKFTVTYKKPNSSSLSTSDPLTVTFNAVNIDTKYNVIAASNFNMTLGTYNGVYGYRITGFKNTVSLSATDKPYTIPSTYNGYPIVSINDTSASSNKCGVFSSGNSVNGSNNTALKNIVIPSTVVELGIGTFHYNNLQSVTLPAGLTEIPSECFAGMDTSSGNSTLTHIVFPKNLKKIGSSAFWKCYAFSKTSSSDPVGTLPITLKTIEQQAFQHTNAKLKYAGTADDWNNNVTVGSYNHFTVYFTDETSKTYS